MSKYWLPWLVGMPAETALAICSLIFCGVLERLPKLRICFAHGGGSFPYTVGRIGHGFDSRPDLCAVDNAFTRAITSDVFTSIRSFTIPPLCVFSSKPLAKTALRWVRIILPAGEACPGS
jgi:predicted TIM-barrel fold metal-dependent hydrolase